MRSRVPARRLSSFLRIQYDRAALAAVLMLLAAIAGCQRLDETVDPSSLKPGEMTVMAVSPDSGELPLTGTLALRFAGAAVPDSLADGSALDPAPGVISPPVTGFWKWQDPATLVFVPGQRYETNTAYRVRLRPEVLRRSGLRLRGRREFEFRVEPFRVLGYSLQRYRVEDRQRTYRIQGEVRFNHPVAPEAFIDALECEFEGVGSIPVATATTSVGRSITFLTEPVEAGGRNREFIATIASSLRPVEGSLGLNQSARRSLTVPAIERLKINELRVTGDDGKPKVIMELSEQVDADELLKVLKVTPEVENLRITGRWRQIQLDGEWRFDQRYELELPAGLTSERGLTLDQSYHGSVFIDDLDPWLRIAGTGNYLSLRGERRLAVESVNVAELDVSVDRVFANNLVPFLQENQLRDRDQNWRWNLEAQGGNIYRGQMNVARVRNAKVTTPVDLRDLLNEGSRGIFRLTVSRQDEYRPRDSRWIVATDLGLVAKWAGERMLVAVASVADLQPLTGVTIQVFSYNNQMLAEGRTDDEGLVELDGLDRTGGQRPYVVVASHRQDLSFLALDETRIPTADLDVGGVSVAATGYRAFIYGDRDLYRPGDRAHVAWMVRDARLQAPSRFPLTLRVYAPEGQEFMRQRVTCDEAGTGEYTVELPRWVQTGRYTVVLNLDDETSIGRATFSVEDFIPDRMKVEARLLVDDSPPAIVAPGDSLELAATALTLFGPPAAARRAEANLWYERAQVVLPAWEGYTFGDPAQDSLPPRRSLGEAITDEDGSAAWAVALPELPGYHGWLRLNTSVTVSESGGGRAVVDSDAALFSPVNNLLGLRNLSASDSDYAEPGDSLRFAAVLVDLKGNALPAADVTVRVMRRRWRTVLKREGAGYRYVSEYDEHLDQELTLDLAAAATDLEVTVNRNGSYRLVAVTADGSARGALDFYVYGSGYSPWAMTDPETVNLKLDRESYSAGGMVTASVEAPFPGLMLLTMEREGVRSHQWVRLQDNTATVRMQLPPDSAPNTYLVATLLRPLSELDPRAPARAFGAVPVFVDRQPMTLPVELVAPQEMRPRTTLTARVRLPDLPAGVPARITVAAVDEGILQITGQPSPSPLDFFLKRRRLSVQSFDIWSQLLPEYQRVLRQSSPGGGAGLADAEAEMKAQGSRLNPLAVDRVKPVALWSGLLTGGRDWQTVEFAIPEFNGALRLMAVAVAGARFGAAEQPVRVADPLVLSPSLPRFLAPGDTFRVPVSVYNGATPIAGESLPVTVDVATTGPVAVVAHSPTQVELDIPAAAERVAWFDLFATDEVGPASIQFTAAAAGEAVSNRTDLSVRAPRPLEIVVNGGVAREDEPGRVRLGNWWYPGSGAVTVKVAANPMARFGAALPYLLRYPYGCAEQITSRSFPLVHFGELAARLAPEAFGSQDSDYFVNSGIDYLTSLYRPGRGFAMWPGRSSAINPWATTYVTHFLLEARRGGFVVAEDILAGALDRLEELARTSENGWQRGWTHGSRARTRAYACYVLALANRPQRGAMDQLASNSWDLLAPAARAHLAGAYALIGNQARFEALLPAADAPLTPATTTDNTWHSSTRDQAIRMEVLATVAPEHPQVPQLLLQLADRAHHGRWYNTQENGFALVGLGKLAAAGLSDAASGVIRIGDATVAEFSTDGLAIRGDEWSDETITVQPTGPGTAWFTVLEEGVPRQGGETDLDAGLQVERIYLDENGDPVDVLAIVQGQTLVCRLTLTSDKGRVEDVVITDLVPAGLEIENPRLDRSGSFAWIDSHELSEYRRLRRDHLEIRDDRLLLFTSTDGRPAVFYYTLRAVTVGRFTLPPIKAEAMYDPDVRSVRGRGEVRVIAPQ